MSETMTRTRRCTCSHTTWPPASLECRRGHLIEDHPNLVEPEFFAPWTMEPVGPFRLQIFHESHDVTLLRQRVEPTIDRIADAFVAQALPLQDGYVAFVMDESFRVIVACSAMRTILNDFGHPSWYGVQAAFGALERVGVDPVDVAIWSELAKRCAR